MNEPDLLDAAQRFARDGVVHLPRLVGPHWLRRLATGVEHNRRRPSRWAYQYTEPGSTVGFWTDYVTWPEVAEYRAAVFESGLAEVAATLMGSASVRFFHEHVLVKEPECAQVTPWHHDQPYYCVDGDQNVSMWIALDPVPATHGLTFLAGSHRSGRWYVPRQFLDAVPYAAPDDRFALVPDDPAPDDDRLRSWDVEPGDVLAFHFRTLHAGAGTLGLPGRRRAVSLRWLGDDATFALRPWLHSPPFEPDGLVEGGPLDDPRFPLVVG